MAKTWLLAGAALAFLAVAFGAFGAHALEKVLSSRYQEVFTTAHRYQMIHALALLLVGLLTEFYSFSLNVPGYSFLAGILLFSGSLYGLVLSGWKILGAITPLGGLLFLLGWASLFWQLLKIRGT